MMTEKIGIIFRQAPHGNSSGREGLDMVLALSAFTSQIALFFIDDGVYQLLANQQPEHILSRNYPATFAALPFYEIDECYLCNTSVQQRFLQNSQFIVAAPRLDADQLQQQLRRCSKLFTF